MAVTFKVETSKLLSTASQFQSSASVWNSTINQMISLVNSTGCQWCGTAADSFRRKFRQHGQDRQDIYSLINEHVSDLQKIASNYQKTENSISSSANSLRTNVVH